MQRSADEQSAGFTPDFTTMRSLQAKTSRQHKWRGKKNTTAQPQTNNSYKHPMGKALKIAPTAINKRKNSNVKCITVKEKKSGHTTNKLLLVSARD